MPDLIERYPGLSEVETPAYVYDLDRIGAAHRRLTGALPRPSELYYSLKANPHPAVAGALAEAGCTAEVCSPGELRTALEAGYDPARMLYTGPGKRTADIETALAAGVRRFSADSPYALDQLDRVAGARSTPVEVLLRVNDDSPVPGPGLTMTGVTSQFGADAGWIRDEPERFKSRQWARLTGLHLYMGSNLSGEDELVAQFAQAAATARTLAAGAGIDLEVLDLGGGFGAPFARGGDLPDYPGLAERTAAALDADVPGWRAGRPVVAFESGRYLTATGGTLLTRVLDVKRSQGRTVVVLESGINHLGGMSGLRRLPPIVPDVLGGAGTPVPETVIAGPLCSPLDTWARSAAIGELAPGDLVTVPNVGAYGLYASLLAFLGHPAPIEVVVAGGRITDVSRLALRRDRS